MPKRAVTLARRAQLQRWERAGALARRAHGRPRSWSNPIPLRKAINGKPWPAAIPGSFGTVRRHKLGGKAYQKKSGDSFTPAPEALAILAGTGTFRDPTKSALESHTAMAKLRPKSVISAKPKSAKTKTK